MWFVVYMGCLQIELATPNAGTHECTSDFLRTKVNKQCCQCYLSEKKNGND